ncbi:hypothetical protein ASG52_04235 [Methylobacterium sp. Leaf456]|nr:hypothetical protein ASG52_04235 [Methylobacterium sp. Leaf456]
MRSGRAGDTEAGKAMPDNQEAGLAKRCAEPRRQFYEAFDDPRSPIPAEEVFGELRTHIARDRKADERGA